MHFTREPVIETVITPKEGCKLVVRSSKSGREDYFVDAVEVVSFGNSFFFRSLERPKSFLLPVSDYEVIELKETRMVLKNASSDKSIKIAPQSEGTDDEEKLKERSEERKKRRYRSRRRNTGSKKKEMPTSEKETESNDSHSEIPKTENVPEDTSSFLKRLIPPPPILIKERLSREKPVEEILTTDAPKESSSEENSTEKKPQKEELSPSETI